jgi:hypothetical protein
MPAGGGAQTNDLGEFRLHSLAPGEYYVRAAPRSEFDRSFDPGTTAATVMLATYFPDTSDLGAAQRIVVTAGQTTTDVVVRMAMAAAFTVSGIVTDDGGQPVAHAMVRLVPRDASARQVPMFAPFIQARSDATGTFSLANVTSGSYTLVAVAPHVVSAGTADAGATGAEAGAGFASFTAVAGAVSGSIVGMVTTESRDGTTVEYRDDAGTQVAVDVNDDNVTGLQVVVRRR